MTQTTRRRNARGEGERLRQELIRAASQLLESLPGEESLSLRAVARQAGVSAPSVYLHFADKGELVGAVLATRFAELDRAMAAAADRAASPEAELWERCAAYVAATPNGISEGRYATPSADDTHLPVKPSPDGVGKSTRVASPSEIFLSDEQPENMEDMFVTSEVSQPETSREARDEQPENVSCMRLTLEVSQPERPREVSFEQP